MSLEGAQLNFKSEAGASIAQPAKGRKFIIGSSLSCDLVLPEAERLHCEIQCDAFGRITIHNHSRQPILLNGQLLKVKSTLLHGAKITLLDKDYVWDFAKISECPEPTTPEQLITKPEQPPNSCPMPKLQGRRNEQRMTVHNFRYSINSDDEGNTSIESRDQSDAQLDLSIESELELNATNAAEEDSPKVDLLEATQNKENGSTPVNLQLLKLCARSDVVVTSFSPRETGVQIEKSFTRVVKPNVGVATPKSVYSTPKSVLAEQNEDSSDLLDFSTPSTSKKKATSMFLIDLTTPQKFLRNKETKKTPSSSSSESVLSLDSSPLVIDITNSASPPSLSKAKTNANATPKRTPQSLMKRALLTSTKKQISALKRDTKATPTTTPTTTPVNSAAAVRRALAEKHRVALSMPYRRLPFLPYKTKTVATAAKGKQTSPRRRLSSASLSSPRPNKLSQMRQSLADAKRSSPIGVSNKLKSKARRALNSPSPGRKSEAVEELSTPQRRTFTIEDERERTMAETLADLITGEGDNKASSSKALLQKVNKRLEQKAEELNPKKAEAEEELEASPDESQKIIEKEEVHKDKEEEDLDGTFTVNEGEEKIEEEKSTEALIEADETKEKSKERINLSCEPIENADEMGAIVNTDEGANAEEEKDAATPPAVDIIEESLCEELLLSNSEEDTPTNAAKKDAIESMEEEEEQVAPPGETPMPRRSSRRCSMEQRSSLAASNLTPRRSTRRASMEASGMLAKSNKMTTRRASCSNVEPTIVAANLLATPKRKRRLTAEPKSALPLDEAVGDMGIIVEEFGAQAAAVNENSGTELTDEPDKIDYQGMRELLKTPKSCSTPRFKGLREMMRTPKVQASPLLDNIEELMETSPASTPKSHHLKRFSVARVNLEQSQTVDPNLSLDKFFKTPRAKNIMIPNEPNSAVLTTHAKETATATEYDLNATNASLQLDKIFDDVTENSIINVVDISAAGDDADPLAHNKTQTENSTASSELLMSIGSTAAVSARKDPLTSTTYKTAAEDLHLDRKNEELEPSVQDMSGIQMLDQTNDSMFSEALMVSGVDADETVEETKATSIIYMANRTEVEDITLESEALEDSMGLAEPLIVSDDDEEAETSEKIEANGQMETEAPTISNISIISTASDEVAEDKSAEDESIVEADPIEPIKNAQQLENSDDVSLEVKKDEAVTEFEENNHEATAGQEANVSKKVEKALDESVTTAEQEKSLIDESIQVEEALNVTSTKAEESIAETSEEIQDNGLKEQMETEALEISSISIISTASDEVAKAKAAEEVSFVEADPIEPIENAQQLVNSNDVSVEVKATQEDITATKNDEAITDIEENKSKPTAEQEANVFKEAEKALDITASKEINRDESISAEEQKESFTDDSIQIEEALNVTSTKAEESIVELAQNESTAAVEQDENLIDESVALQYLTSTKEDETVIELEEPVATSDQGSNDRTNVSAVLEESMTELESDKSIAVELVDESLQNVTTSKADESINELEQNVTTADQDSSMIDESKEVKISQDGITNKDLSIIELDQKEAETTAEASSKIDELDQEEETTIEPSSINDITATTELDQDKFEADESIIESDQEEIEEQSSNESIIELDKEQPEAAVEQKSKGDVTTSIQDEPIKELDQDESVAYRLSIADSKKSVDESIVEMDQEEAETTDKQSSKVNESIIKSDQEEPEEIKEQSSKVDESINELDQKQPEADAELKSKADVTITLQDEPIKKLDQEESVAYRLSIDDSIKKVDKSIIELDQEETEADKSIKELDQDKSEAARSSIDDSIQVEAALVTSMNEVESFIELDQEEPAEQKESSVGVQKSPGEDTTTNDDESVNQLELNANLSTSETESDSKELTTTSSEDDAAPEKQMELGEHVEDTTSEKTPLIVPEIVIADESASTDQTTDQSLQEESLEATQEPRKSSTTTINSTEIVASEKEQVEAKEIKTITTIPEIVVTLVESDDCVVLENQNGPQNETEAVKTKLDMTSNTSIAESILSETEQKAEETNSKNDLNAAADINKEEIVNEAGKIVDKNTTIDLISDDESNAEEETIESKAEQIKQPETTDKKNEEAGKEIVTTEDAKEIETESKKKEDVVDKAADKEVSIDLISDDSSEELTTKTNAKAIEIVELSDSNSDEEKDSCKMTKEEENIKTDEQVAQKVETTDDVKTLEAIDEPAKSIDTEAVEKAAAAVPEPKENIELAEPAEEFKAEAAEEKVEAKEIATTTVKDSADHATKRSHHEDQAEVAEEMPAAKRARSIEANAEADLTENITSLKTPRQRTRKPSVDVTPVNRPIRRGRKPSVNIEPTAEITTAIDLREINETQQQLIVGTIATKSTYTIEVKPDEEKAMEILAEDLPTTSKELLEEPKKIVRRGRKPSVNIEEEPKKVQRRGRKASAEVEATKKAAVEELSAIDLSDKDKKKRRSSTLKEQPAEIEPTKAETEPIIEPKETINEELPVEEPKKSARRGRKASAEQQTELEAAKPIKRVGTRKASATVEIEEPAEEKTAAEEVKPKQRRGRKASATEVIEEQPLAEIEEQTAKPTEKAKRGRKASAEEAPTEAAKLEQKPKRRGRTPVEVAPPKQPMPEIVEKETADKKQEEISEKPKRRGQKEASAEPQEKKLPARRGRRATPEVEAPQKHSEEVVPLSPIEEVAPPMPELVVEEAADKKQEQEEISEQPAAEKPKRRGQKEASAEPIEKKLPSRRGRRATPEVEPPPKHSEEVVAVATLPPIEEVEPPKPEIVVEEAADKQPEQEEISEQPAAEKPKRRGQKEASVEPVEKKLPIKRGRRKTPEVEPPPKQSEEVVALLPPIEEAVPSAEPLPEKKTTRRARRSVTVEAEVEAEAAATPAKKPRRGRKASAQVDEAALKLEAELNEQPLDLCQVATPTTTTLQVPTAKPRRSRDALSSPGAAASASNTEDELTPRRREGRNLPRKNYDETSDEDKNRRKQARKQPAAGKAKQLEASPTTSKETQQEEAQPAQKEEAKPKEVAPPSTPLLAVAPPPASIDSSAQRREGRNLPRKNYDETSDEDRPTRARRGRNAVPKALQLETGEAARPATPKRRKGKAETEEPPTKKLAAEIEEATAATASKARAPRSRKATVETVERESEPAVVVIEEEKKKPAKRAARGKAKASKELEEDKEADEQPASKKARGKTPADSEAEEEAATTSTAKKRAPVARGRARGKAAAVTEPVEEEEDAATAAPATAAPTRAARGRKVHFEAAEEAAAAAAAAAAQSSEVEPPKRATRSRRK